MHDVRELGIDAVVEQTTAIVGDVPAFLSVDVDVLDPAFAPGTGTPEPGGMTSADLLRACRMLASRLRVVGMDVVEVIPTAVGSADVTALVAERVVREMLTGLAVHGSRSTLSATPRAFSRRLRRVAMAGDALEPGLTTVLEVDAGTGDQVACRRGHEHLPAVAVSGRRDGQTG
jgi:hypothetical protein